MAKLPDSTVLGGVDFASRRPIASYDDTVLAKGDAAMGEAIGGGLQSVGKGTADLGTGLAIFEERKGAAERTQARAELLAAKVDLDSRYAQDTNYKDMKDRYEKELSGIAEKAAGLIQTPGNRERFLTEIQPTVRHGVASTLARARKLEGETNVGYVLEQGPKLTNAALGSDDPAVKNQAIQSYNDQVDSLVLRGYRTPEQALQMKREFAHQYGVAATAAKIDTDPAGVIAELSNPKGTVYEFMRPAEREQLLRQARLGVQRQETKDAFEQAESYERQIIDAAAGLGAMPDREAIETDTVLDPTRRNALLRQHDAANAKAIKYQAFDARYADPQGGPFNPFDKDTQDAVDRKYQMLGGGLPALEAVVGRTGIVPKSAVTEMRGALVSGDPKRVAGALQLAANLNARNPAILSAGVQGSKEIEDAVTLFQHRVEDLGMTAEQAAAKHVESLTPEYQAKVKAKIKGEDLNEIVKKQVSVDDLRGAFDASWWPGKPQVGVSPEQRRGMYGDYEELFRENYEKTGDVEQSKALAIKQLRKTWGVSSVTGKDVVMRYPPDRAPIYAGFEDAPKQIADQALAAIKQTTGQTVTPDKLRFVPLSGGRTSMPYWRGEAPPYRLIWEDDKGILNELVPGKGFVADPEPMRASKAEALRKRTDQSRARRDFMPGSGGPF
jgi:hypothetical protein